MTENAITQHRSHGRHRSRRADARPPHEAARARALCDPPGRAGLGGAWAAANGLLVAPSWPDEVLYGPSTALWLPFTAIYLWQCIWDGGSFIADLKHPATGPFTSFIPPRSILLSAHYSQYALTLGTWACVLFILSLMINAASLFAHWATAGVALNIIHPGYFAPIVAGSFVASLGLSSVPPPRGVGCLRGRRLFWPILTAVVTARLMAAGPLPPIIVPSLSAFLATAGTASVAWIVSHPGPLGDPQYILTGVLMMILIQIVFVEEYRKLSFSFSFWVFTFPIAVKANYAVRWFAASGLEHWDTWAWTALALASAFVVAISAKTVVLIAGRRPASVPAPATP
jgi:tellurite resistance protein TehA-like permease